jgi:hypothetical protein
MNLSKCPLMIFKLGTRTSIVLAGRGSVGQIIVERQIRNVKLQTKGQSMFVLDKRA